MLVLNGVEVVVVELFSWQTAIEKRKTSRESIILNKYLKRVKNFRFLEISFLDCGKNHLVTCYQLAGTYKDNY